MFNNSYTTTTRLIEDIMREYPFTAMHLDEVNEWVYKALDILGRQEVLVESVAEVKISDFKGYLPVDMYRFIGCRNRENKIPLLPSSDRYFEKNIEDSGNSIINAIVQSISVNIESTRLGENVINEIKESTAMLELQSNTDFSNKGIYYYRLNEGYIFTGINNITLEIAYYAFPTWEDNTPKVPDDEKVIRYLITYVAEKIMQRLYYIDPTPAKSAILNDIRDQHVFNTGSAQNRLKMPDIDTMEAIKNQQMRIRKKPNEWSNGFKGNSIPERIRNM